MSDTHANEPAAPRSAARAPARPTGWVGWIIFAGVTMIVLGAFSIIEGLVAVFQTSYYRVNANLLVHVSYHTWGWAHFGIGCAIALVGFGVMTGAMVARVLGIVFAVISAIVNLPFIAAYPVWAVMIIALDVLVIYALAVHGREMKSV
jgi:hypothetical protein